LLEFFSTALISFAQSIRCNFSLIKIKSVVQPTPFPTLNNTFYFFSDWYICIFSDHTTDVEKCKYTETFFNFDNSRIFIEDSGMKNKDEHMLCSASSQSVMFLLLEKLQLKTLLLKNFC
jgi:hypothetical protein